MLPLMQLKAADLVCLELTQCKNAKRGIVILWWFARSPAAARQKQLVLSRKSKWIWICVWCKGKAAFCSDFGRLFKSSMSRATTGSSL